MKISTFSLRLVFVISIIFLLGNVSAAAPKKNNAPKLEYFGSLTYRDIGEVKNFHEILLPISEVEL